VLGLRLASADHPAERHAEADVRRVQHGEDREQVVLLACPRRLDLLDLVAQSCQELGGVARRALADRVHLRVDRRARGQRDPQPSGVARQGLCKRLGRRRCPGGVAGLVAGHDVEGAGTVLDRPREETVGGEDGVAQVRPARDPPAARLEPDEAAAGRRDPDRAAAVAAVRDRHHAGRHRGGRAAGRAARRAIEVPGVARRAKAARLGDRHDPELRRAGLADDHEAGVLQPAHDERVVVGCVVAVEVGTIGHPQPGDRSGEVLDPDRHARKRTLVAGPDPIGGSEGTLGVHQREGVDAFVERLDARERRLHQLARRHFAATDQRRQLGGGAEEQLLRAWLVGQQDEGAYGICGADSAWCLVPGA
jgi:hypothetical protein